MDRIIAGRFDHKRRADEAVSRLDKWVKSSDIFVFHNNAPGQHGRFPTGGDESVDRDAKGAGKHSATVAVVSGVAAGALAAMADPEYTLAAAAAGAYAGSLAGALQGLGGNEDSNSHQYRRSGVIVAVKVENPEQEQSIVNVLTEAQAVDIEATEGTWRNGSWIDFNPLTPPRLLT